MSACCARGSPGERVDRHRHGERVAAQSARRRDAPVADRRRDRARTRRNGGGTAHQPVPLQDHRKPVPEEPGLDGPARRSGPPGRRAAVAEPVLPAHAVRAQRPGDRQRRRPPDPRRGHAGLLREPRGSGGLSGARPARRPRAAADRQLRARPRGAEPDLEHVLAAVPALGALPGRRGPARPAGGRPAARYPSGYAASACPASGPRISRPRSPAWPPRPARRGRRSTFTGEHLAGWRADVAVGDRHVLAGERARPATPSPPRCPPTVAGLLRRSGRRLALFRRTFLFEVTP